ncbi:hypothetical protein [Bradyrhizobium sp. CCGUVB23]|uniref:hypothetical protein n=1 Tax=Bradyrhizobium sp. CCGUVB23 TaxID=2949630 RepID=UPI0020B391DE|nr:hypothetical protein [Bradyrhizobium sp. CCGUVB23]MCP3468028.1 hypothetical protein [Bradyrhizobium sp. CCGUVB23]
MEIVDKRVCETSIDANFGTAAMRKRVRKSLPHLTSMRPLAAIEAKYRVRLPVWKPSLVQSNFAQSAVGIGSSGNSMKRVSI